MIATHPIQITMTLNCNRLIIVNKIVGIDRKLIKLWILISRLKRDIGPRDWQSRPPKSTSWTN